MTPFDAEQVARDAVRRAAEEASESKPKLNGKHPPNGADDTEPEPEEWPDFLTDLWDQLEDPQRWLLRGPWFGSDMDHRCATSMCMRLLRHHGLTIEQTIKSAACFHDGFGKLRNSQGGLKKLIANLWREKNVEETKENDNSSDEFESSLSDLQKKEFKDIMWIVPNYIPEGLTVFAGKPKIGKSWLMLDVALGVARGTETLGESVEKGDVLYCGLEDGERRMQSRVRKILGSASGGEWPTNFRFRWRLNALDAGGVDYIEQWLIEHPERRLVVIDTLGKVRGTKRKDEEQYQFDYRMIGALQELATTYRVAIVVVHHVRKADAEDVLDTVSGTTGIAGAADNIIVLGRCKHGVKLSARGRDTEEQDKLVEFDPETAIWSVTGDFDEFDPESELQGMRKNIVHMLTQSSIPLMAGEIAERLGKPRATVRKFLTRMANSKPPQVAKSEQTAGAYEALKPL